MKSTPLELSYSMSHNSNTEFMSEVILITSFSKNTSIGNIFKCKNTTKLEKRYFSSTYKGLLTDTYCWDRFWILWLSISFMRIWVSLQQMFLLCNTWYNKSVETIIARGWTLRFCRDISFKNIYDIFNIVS